MKLLQQLHIWKLRSCAARHEKRAKALKKRLLSEIRSLNLEIREQEYRQQICTRLASRKAFRAEKGKVSNMEEKGQGGSYTLEEMMAYNADRYSRMLRPPVPKNRVPFDHSVTHPCATPFEL